MSNEDKEMPFLDHLEELRMRIIRGFLGILIGFIICLALSKPLLKVLLWPTHRVDVPMNLQVLKVQGMFMVTLEIGFFGGLVLSLPYLIYQIWMFIAPGLFPKERKYFPSLVLSATGLFLSGVAFAYFIILPFALEFFLKLATSEIQPNIAIDFYIGFAIRLMVIFGIIFQLPVLTYFLSKIGILTPQVMRKYRRYSIVFIFIIGAILTPPDPFTQVMLAIPLILLYEFSIFISQKVQSAKLREAAKRDAEFDANYPANEEQQ